MTADLSHIAEALRPLAVPIESLTPDPANARKHPQRNVDTIVASLKRFGQRAPIVVQKQGMVVRAGNARLQAAKQIGWTHVAAIIVDEGSVEATAFAIADNRSAELAEWDYEALAPALQAIQEAGILAIDVGFDEHETETILGAIFHAEGEAIDSHPKPVIAFSQEQHAMVLQAAEAWRSRHNQPEASTAEAVVGICEEWGPVPA